MPDSASAAPGLARSGGLRVPAGVRLIGSDLDGTLLDSALEVGPRTRALLPRAVEAGIAFAYVTGRPPRWLRPVVDQTGVAGMAVCANGAVVVDLAQQRLVSARTIDPELAAQTIHLLRAEVPGIMFAAERIVAEPGEQHDLAAISVFGMERARHPLWGRPPQVEVADALDLVARGGLIKLLAIPPEGSGHDNDSMLALALAQVAGQLNVTHSGAGFGLIEIMSAQADKGVGFLEVAEVLGIAADETIAVGDMPNDIPLLTAAGTGYAVANAHPATRAAAAALLPSNDEDGVGCLLEAVVAARSPEAGSPQEDR